MPLWLRKYTFSQIRDYYDAEAAANAKAAKGSKGRGKSSTTTNLDFTKPNKAAMPGQPPMQKLS